MPQTTETLFKQLTEAAAAARARYDAALLDPSTAPEVLATRELEVEAAEAARKTALHALRQARTNTPDTGADVYFRQGGETITVQAKHWHDKGVLRDRIADLLDVLGAPARTPTLSTAAANLDDEPLRPAQLVQLRRSEQRQYDRASKGGMTRDWYVVPCLSADTLEAASGTYALSSWPLTDRLITPFASRMWAAQHAANAATAAVRAEGSSRQASLVQLVRQLLRGNSWGRGEQSTDILTLDPTHEWTQLRSRLEQVAVEARHDAQILQAKHTPMADDARARLDALAVNDAAVALWGNTLSEAGTGGQQG